MSSEDLLMSEETRQQIISAAELVPNMPISATPLSDQKQDIISDEEITDIYKEILNNIREDRKQTDDFINNFADLVINEGDSTSASKEALVNLLKIKTDMSDKMSKVADLMTRIKLKDRDTFPKYLAANQSNTININSGNNKRQLIEALNKAKQKKENKDEV
jgi:cellobiose-specific phosphotransferase system component IIA